MGNFLVKRLAHLLVVLFGVTLLTFTLTTFIQGNPAEIVLGQAGIDPTPEEIALMEERMGLNKSLAHQYGTWIKNVVTLDFGQSYMTDKPVLEELAYRVPTTIMLTVAAFITMLVLAVPIGILAVIKKDTWIDYIISGVTFLFMGVPGFVLGLILMYVFAVKLKLLPMFGNQTPLHIILPVITLALPMSCRYIRMIKANLLDALADDYVFLLRTKGIRESVILFRDALKNAFIPIVNLMGITFGNLLGGSVIVENVFSWPGLGSYLMLSINNRDFPVILAYVFLMAFVFVIINFLVDLIVSLLDPRIVYNEGK